MDCLRGLFIPSGYRNRQPPGTSPSTRTARRSTRILEVGYDHEGRLARSAPRRLLRLFDARTQARSWRLGSRPFPLIALEPGVAVDDDVTALERAAAEAGVPHLVAVPGEAPEITLLDAMTKEGVWNGRFGFLVRSFERASAPCEERRASGVHDADRRVERRSTGR